MIHHSRHNFWSDIFPGKKFSRTSTDDRDSKNYWYRANSQEWNHPRRKKPDSGPRDAFGVEDYVGKAAWKDQTTYTLLLCSERQIFLESLLVQQCSKMNSKSSFWKLRGKQKIKKVELNFESSIFWSRNGRTSSPKKFMTSIAYLTDTTLKAVT